MIIEILALSTGAIAAYYGFKQYTHSRDHKEKDIIVNFTPEIKIEPGIKVTPMRVEKEEDKTIKMDDEYYTKLGVHIFRSKKQDDDFDITESK